MALPRYANMSDDINRLVEDWKDKKRIRIIYFLLAYTIALLAALLALILLIHAFVTTVFPREESEIPTVAPTTPTVITVPVSVPAGNERAYVSRYTSTESISTNSGNQVINLDGAGTLRLEAEPHLWTTYEPVTLILNTITVTSDLNSSTGTAITYAGPADKFVFDTQYAKSNTITSNGRTFIVTLRDIKVNPPRFDNLPYGLEWPFKDWTYTFGITEI